MHRVLESLQRRLEMPGLWQMVLTERQRGHNENKLEAGLYRRISRRFGMVNKKSLIPADRIEKAILLIRGQKVMLVADLAELYGVETKVLVQAIKRNLE